MMMQTKSKNITVIVSVAGTGEEHEVNTLAEAKEIVCQNAPIGSLSTVWREMGPNHRRKPNQTELFRHLLKVSDRQIVVFEEKPLQCQIGWAMELKRKRKPIYPSSFQDACLEANEGR